jgi:hypothetical protein
MKRATHPPFVFSARVAAVLALTGMDFDQFVQAFEAGC